MEPPSNASKQRSGKLSELERKKDKLEAKMKRLSPEHEREDKGEDDPSGPGSFLWGYKAQALVDDEHQVVVHAETSGTV